MPRLPDLEGPTPDGDVIVVGLDGSAHSWRALDWAIAEARRSGRSLRLVHAWRWSDSVMPPSGLTSPRASRDLLVRAASHARRWVPTETRSLEGNAVTVLSRASSGSAMLVLGSHRRGAIGTMVLGSVGSGCVQGCHCPICIVPIDVVSPVPAGQAAPAGAAGP